MSHAPPVAKRIPHVETRHDRSVADDYHWLRDRSDPDVTAYLEAENAYTEAVMRPTAKLQKRLYAEILGRIKENDQSVPARYGNWRYYRRTEEGSQYAIHCRRPDGREGPEQILLDENELARELKYFRLGALEVSPRHDLLAYAFDPDGSESYTLRFIDLATGKPLDDEIRGAYTGLEWAADNRTIFYSTIDAAHRPHRLYRHALGQPQDKDVLVHEEPDEAFFLDVYKTKDGRYLMLSMESNTTSEVRFVDAAAPEGRFTTLRARQSKVEYCVEHQDGRFLMLTNEGAVNFKLMQVAVGALPEEGWTELIPHRPEVKLDELQSFAGHVVLVERRNGCRGIRIVCTATGEQHVVELPEPVYTVDLHGNPEHDSSIVRFTYSSLVTPDSVFDYDMGTRERQLLKVYEVVGGHDREAYCCERIEAEAGDGTPVPISLVYRRDMRRTGGNPLLLYGYGSYGISIEPEFDSARLSLLDRGVAFAIAHVRGGGERGRPWYEAGKLEHKQNTFTDFIACAEKLIADGHTTVDRLAIAGGSAGGLLIGAVTNLRADLFRVVLAKVPFVDVVNTMCDDSLPLTVIEREEWGDPRNLDDHQRMLAYSPYDNVAERPYGDMLVTAGLNDPRVCYWEPAKWVAKLRAANANGNLLLLKTDMSTGHGGPSGRYDRIRETAFEYAFILTRLSAALPDTP